MLTKKQISEIKVLLEKSQNPLFFFDNDQDGFCAFLILRRALERGKGIAVKNTPMGKEYFRRVDEFYPDLIVILDQPEVSLEFFQEVEKVNVPVLFIDHHEIDNKKIPDFVNYYNPVFNRKKSNEPTTFLCSSIFKRKDDEWLEVVGCISDRFLPKSYKNFYKQYPELGIKSNDVYDIFYRSEIGKISQILGAGLKDKTTNVVNMIKFLIKCKSPTDVLNENKESLSFHKRFNEINSKYEKLIRKAQEFNNLDKILFFKYSGDISMSSDLANGLYYKFPNKVIVVCYVNGERVNGSARGKKIKEKFIEIFKKIENSSGGGHEDAVGFRMSLNDVDFFFEELKKVVS
ncbi:MAG: DHHA1 domain-containing protein [Candidatus Pacearchaeota archaeon]|jgi:single-stranded DNA-specific DHH superfamily exonuclease